MDCIRFSRAALAALLLFPGLAPAQSNTAKNSAQSNSQQKSAAKREAGEERDDPLARRKWELQRFGDPALYAERILREQERQRALYPAQVPRGRVGEPTRALIPYAGPSWVSLGPTNASFETNGITLNVVDSGRLNTILPHPTDPNTVYVLASGGGLWKTSNFLSSPPTWTPLTDSLLTTGSGAATFGANASVIYLGLGDPFDSSPLAGGAMTKSIDGGATWSTPIKLNNSFVSSNVRDVKIDAGAGTAGQDVVLVATDVGMFRSVDGGASYSPVLASTTFSGLEFWSIVKTSAGWLASSQDDNNGQAGALWISTDHGATWNAITNTNNVLSGEGRTTLGVGAAGDSVVYAFAATIPDPFTSATDQLDLFRSTDGGQNWTALGVNSGSMPTNPNNDQPDMDLMHDQAWYNQMLQVDPTDSNRNTVYIGGNLSSAKSTDGGATWTIITNWLPGGDSGTSGLPYVHADFHTSAFSNISTTKTIFVGTDGGIFCSTDGGTTWNDKKNINLVDDLHYSVTSNPTSPDSTITGLQDLGTRVRETNTSVFDQTLGGDGFGVGTGQANALVTLGSFYYDNIQSSDDLGVDPTHWVDASSGLNPNTYLCNQAGSPPCDQGFFTEVTTPRASADSTGKVFFTTGVYNVNNATVSKIFKTTDGGATWNAIGTSGAGGIIATVNLEDGVHSIGVSPVDINHVAVAAHTGYVAITTNGGASWTEPDVGTAVTNWGFFNANVAWANDSILYLCSESNTAGTVRVARSADGGATWAAAANGLPDVQVSEVLVDPNDSTGNTVYAATFIGVYQTTNGGTSWTLFGAGLPAVHVTDMYIPPDGSFLRIATYGRGIWEIPIGKQATTTIVNSNAAPSVFGQSVTFSATVTANSGTPTGTVTFYDGGNNIGTGMLSGGIATLTPPPPLTVGTHNITASYGGDTKFSSSTSAVFPQEVDPAATSIALMSSANPSINGSSVTFTATVTVTPPGAGTPNGLVTFADNGSTIGTGMLSSGTATFATSNLIVGLHPITASYGGDTDFSSSVSGTLSQTVDPTSGPNADLGVMVTHSSTHAAAIGGTWTETITVTNSQASPADSPSTALTVNVTGEYAAAALNIVSAPNGASCNSTNLTCSLGTLSIGSSATVTLTLTPLLGRSISIQASVSGGLPDNSPANNNKTDVIQVRHRPLTVKP